MATRHREGGTSIQLGLKLIGDVTAANINLMKATFRTLVASQYYSTSKAGPGILVTVWFLGHKLRFILVLITITGKGLPRSGYPTIPSRYPHHQTRDGILRAF